MTRIVLVCLLLIGAAIAISVPRSKLPDSSKELSVVLPGNSPGIQSVSVSQSAKQVAVNFGPGSLKGIVLFDGEPPEMKDHVLPKDHADACKCETVKNETLVVDKATKGIKWVMVRILDVKDAPELKDPPKVTLNQLGCRYEPHVFTIAPGSELTVLNPDLIGHNVKTVQYDGLNLPTNQMMVNEKMVLKSKFFAEPEIINIQCSIHGWMSCFAVVHDPRFAAISGADGKFEIKDLPPGKYKVSVFHETLGEKNFDVEIKPGSATDLGEIKFIKK